VRTARRVSTSVNKGRAERKDQEPDRAAEGARGASLAAVAHAEHLTVTKP